MWLLLDAHICGRIAQVLRDRGHDVRAADEERVLDGWPDEELLALAVREQRIMVTFDVKDFPGIVGRRSEGQRDHGEFGTLRVLESQLVARPDPASCTDYTVFVARSGQ